MFGPLEVWITITRFETISNKFIILAFIFIEEGAITHCHKEFHVWHLRGKFFKYWSILLTIVIVRLYAVRRVRPVLKFGNTFIDKIYFVEILDHLVRYTFVLVHLESFFNVLTVFWLELAVVGCYKPE